MTELCTYQNCPKLLLAVSTVQLWGRRGPKRKFEINPMKNYATRPGDLKKQPRCGARTRAGAPCRRPPVRGRKRCRLHGGLSPGAPRGLKNGNYKTGDWTSEAITERKWLRSLVHSFAKSGTTE